MVGKFIHSYPNFCEGRRPEVIGEIVDALAGQRGVKLIQADSDADFNRTSTEVVGEPGPLKQGILAMAERAYALIDMEGYDGAHPHIGALDLVPFYPLRGSSIEECIALAEETGRDLYERFEVPVYFSGETARSPERRDLGFIRRGMYAGLKEVAHLPERAPDIGPAALHPHAGATIVAAYSTFMVGFNVMLGTDDVAVAKKIARMVSGTSGGFSTVRAAGMPQSERGGTTVSMDVWDPEMTPLHRIYNVIETEAERLGVPVTGSAICGTVTQDALVTCAEHFLRLEGFDRKMIVENQLLELSVDGEAT